MKAKYIVEVEIVDDLDNVDVEMELQNGFDPLCGDVIKVLSATKVEDKDENGRPEQ